MKLEQRANNNEYNCKTGVMQILYSLAEHGLLREPFRSWAAGLPIGEEKDLEQYNKAIEDISQSIIMFIDEVKEDGKILG